MFFQKRQRYIMNKLLITIVLLVLIAYLIDAEHEDGRRGGRRGGRRIFRNGFGRPFGKRRGGFRLNRLKRLLKGIFSPLRRRRLNAFGSTFNPFNKLAYNIEGVQIQSNLPIKHHHKLVPHVDETGLHNDVITKDVAPVHPTFPHGLPPMITPVIGAGATIIAPGQVHELVPHTDHTGPHLDVISQANVAPHLDSTGHHHGIH